MIGEGVFEIQDYQVLMLGEGTFDVLDIEPIEMIGDGEMYVGSTANYINAFLPEFGCILRETNVNTGDIYAYLPEMSANLVGGLYVPPAIQYIYAVLPPLTASIFVQTSNDVSIDATLPEFACKLADHEYGEISADLAPMVGFMVEDPTPDTAQIVSIAYALDGAIAQAEFILVIDSYGQITTTITGTKEYIAQLLSTLNASGTVSSLGEFLVSIDSSGVFQTSAIGIVNDRPSVDFEGRVWVVNMDTGASSQYDNYGYNSFFERDGQYYGVADDGIYLLDGDDDEGDDIDALIEFGRSSLYDVDGNRINRKKKIVNVYVGVSSDNKM